MDNLNMTALARNQNNVSDWSDMSTRGLLFQWASTIKNPTQCNQTSPSSHWKLPWTRHNIVEKILNWRKTTTNQPINKSSKLIWRNRSAAIMSRDMDSIPSCLIVVLFELLIRFTWENEGSVLQFVTINVKNIRKLISTFGKAHSMLSSTITLFCITESTFSAFVALSLCRIYESNCWSSVDKLLFKSSG